jgi:hypothetical protein
MALSLTATDILDQVYACRERDLLRRISDVHGLDYDNLLSTFGSSTMKSGVQMAIIPDLGVDLKSEKKKIRGSSIPENERCMARVWNGGKGGKCSRRGCKGPNVDLCGNHARCLEAKGCLPQGRMDGDVPENMISNVDSIAVSPVETEDCQNQVLEVGEIDSQLLDNALEELVVSDVSKDESVIPGEDINVEKKKRGRPKGRKSKKGQTVDENDSLVSGEAEILQEDEMKSCVSQDDIQSCMEDYLSGGNLSEMSVSTAKKAIEKKLNISNKDYDKKWFKTTFDSMKSDLEAAEAEKKKAELAKAADVALAEEEEYEEDANDSDSEEVACQELTVGGKVYLLDPESMKVYSRESPNGFVGKYDGSQIDFDAEDSDADSDDED